jgi:hypothetical protein
VKNVTVENKNEILRLGKTRAAMMNKSPTPGHVTARTNHVAARKKSHSPSSGRHLAGDL